MVSKSGCLKVIAGDANISSAQRGREREGNRSRRSEKREENRKREKGSEEKRRDYEKGKGKRGGSTGDEREGHNKDRDINQKDTQNT
jgi:hypothetical protein